MQIIDALYALDRRRFIYLDQNRIVGACPICTDGYVHVHFKGTAARADIRCSFGCDEREVGDVLTGSLGAVR